MSEKNRLRSRVEDLLLIASVVLVSPIWLKLGLDNLEQNRGTIFAFVSIVFMFLTSSIYLTLVFLPERKAEFSLPSNEKYLLSIVCILGFAIAGMVWKLMRFESIEIAFFISFGALLLVSPLFPKLSRKYRVYRDQESGFKIGTSNSLVLLSYFVILIALLLIVPVYLIFVVEHSMFGNNIGGFFAVVLLVVVPIHALGLFVLTRISQVLGIKKRIIRIRAILSILLFLSFLANLFIIFHPT